MLLSCLYSCFFAGPFSLVWSLIPGSLQASILGPFPLSLFPQDVPSGASTPFCLHLVCRYHLQPRPLCEPQTHKSIPVQTPVGVSVSAGLLCLLTSTCCFSCIPRPPPCVSSILVPPALMSETWVSSGCFLLQLNDKPLPSQMFLESAVPSALSVTWPLSSLPAPVAEPSELPNLHSDR